MRKALLSYLIVALSAGPALCSCVAAPATEPSARANSTTAEGCPHCRQARTETPRPAPRREQCPCRQLGQCGLLQPAIKPSHKATELPLTPALDFGTVPTSITPQFELVITGVASHRPFWDPLDLIEKHHRLRC
jgi:hypothetical protein